MDQRFDACAACHGATGPRERDLQWVLQPVDACVTGTIYTDGSMVDGSPYLDGLCRRLGWAFAALDQRGTVTASAHVWVDTVYGAEL